MIRDEITKEKLYDLYIIENLTRNKIAEKLNVKPRYIKFLLSKYNIKKDSKNKALNNKGKHNISEEARKRLSENATKRFKGKRISSEHKSKIANYYKIHGNPKKDVPRSPETKAKISKALIGHEQKHPIRDIINTLSEKDCKKYLSSAQVIDFTSIFKYLHILNNQYNQQLIIDRYDVLKVPYKLYTSTSLFETEVYTYIKSIYKNIIVTNDKKTLYPYELDILLPKLNIAFECNGIYWHCSEIIGKKSKSQIKLKDSDYHKNKIKLGMSKNIFIINV